MKLTEQRLKRLINEEAMKLREENVYELSADDIVKIVYGDEDRKVYSHIKNIASKLGLADNPLRGPTGPYEAPTGAGRREFGGPEQNTQHIKKRLKQLGFDDNEISQMREMFNDAAKKAAKKTEQEYPSVKNAFDNWEYTFSGYAIPRPQDYPAEALRLFHNQTRSFAKKNLERLNFID